MTQAQQTRLAELHRSAPHHDETILSSILNEEEVLVVRISTSIGTVTHFIDRLGESRVSRLNQGSAR